MENMHSLTNIIFKNQFPFTEKLMSLQSATIKILKLIIRKKNLIFKTSHCSSFQAFYLSGSFFLFFFVCFFFSFAVEIMRTSLSNICKTILLSRDCNSLRYITVTLYIKVCIKFGSPDFPQIYFFSTSFFSNKTLIFK